MEGFGSCYITVIIAKVGKESFQDIYKLYIYIKKEEKKRKKSVYSKIN